MEDVRLVGGRGLMLGVVASTHVCRFIHQFTFVIVCLIGAAIVTLRFDDAIEVARRIAIAGCGAGTVVLIATAWEWGRRGKSRTFIYVY